MENQNKDDKRNNPGRQKDNNPDGLNKDKDSKNPQKKNDGNKPRH